MSYSDATLVQSRAQGLDAAEPAEIQAGIDWADSVIDARLSGRYQGMIPFSPVPAIIATISADLAAYYTIFEMHMAGGENLPVDGAKELKARAYDLLTDLQEGKIALPTVPGSEVASLPPGSILSNNSRAGVLRNFDLVNVPCTNQAPFTRPRRGVW